jgi:uncharacterized membrane protein YgcG
MEENPIPPARPAPSSQTPDARPPAYSAPPAASGPGAVRPDPAQLDPAKLDNAELAAALLEAYELAAADLAAAEFEDDDDFEDDDFEVDDFEDGDLEDDELEAAEREALEREAAESEAAEREAAKSKAAERDTPEPAALDPAGLGAAGFVAAELDAAELEEASELAAADVEAAEFEAAEREAAESVAAELDAAAPEAAASEIALGEPGGSGRAKPAPSQAGRGGRGARSRKADPLRVGSPDSILAVVPSLLGFYPAKSLVIIGASPPRGRIQLTFRYDLPDPPDAGAAAKIAAHAAAILSRQKLPLAVAVGYGPGPLVTPVADALVGQLRRADITLHDMLRVQDGRYWSYTCRNPRCCRPEGVLFDAESHPAAAVMAAAGGKLVRDRAALAASVAPLGGLAEESMRQATRRAEHRAASLNQREAASPDRDGAPRRDIAEGLRAVREAIGIYRRGGKIASDDRIAWLALVIADLRVRDDAWARMEPGHIEAHLRLWTDVVRRAPARYVPAPASLLAFTAWQSGNGALANVALDRALAADPEYSMALLLADAVGAGIPPSAARLPMTPEEVAASYEQAERDGSPDPSPRSRRSSGSRGSSSGSRGSSSESRGSSSGSRGSSSGSRGSSSGSRRSRRGSAGGTRGGSGPSPASLRSPTRPGDTRARTRRSSRSES